MDKPSNSQGVKSALTPPSGIFRASITVAYLPTLQQAIHALQDADACLLGGRAHEGNSAAMGYHREAMVLLRRLPGAR